MNAKYDATDRSISVIETAVSNRLPALAPPGGGVLNVHIFTEEGFAR